jgi:hypothetical protein
MTKSLAKKKAGNKKPAKPVKRVVNKPKAKARKAPVPQKVAPLTTTPATGKIAEVVDMNRLPFEKQAAMILNTFPGEKLGIVIKTRTDKGLHDAHLPKLHVKPPR